MLKAFASQTAKLKIAKCKVECYDTCHKDLNHLRSSPGALCMPWFLHQELKHITSTIAYFRKPVEAHDEAVLPRSRQCKSLTGELWALN